MSFPGGTSSEEDTCQCRRHEQHGFNLWVGKIFWCGNGTPLQYSCLENPWIEEPSGLQSMGPQKVRHNGKTECMHIYRLHIVCYSPVDNLCITRQFGSELQGPLNPTHCSLWKLPVSGIERILVWVFFLHPSCLSLCLSTFLYIFIEFSLSQSVLPVYRKTLSPSYFSNLMQSLPFSPYIPRLLDITYIILSLLTL